MPLLQHENFNGIIKNKTLRLTNIEKATIIKKIKIDKSNLCYYNNSNNTIEIVTDENS